MTNTDNEKGVPSRTCPKCKHVFPAGQKSNVCSKCGMVLDSPRGETKSGVELTFSTRPETYAATVSTPPTMRMTEAEARAWLAALTGVFQE